MCGICKVNKKVDINENIKVDTFLWKKVLKS